MNKAEKNYLKEIIIGIIKRVTWGGFTLIFCGLTFVISYALVYLFTLFFSVLGFVLWNEYFWELAVSIIEFRLIFPTIMTGSAVIISLMIGGVIKI